jgi:hypothetical protein
MLMHTTVYPVCGSVVSDDTGILSRVLEGTDAQTYAAVLHEPQ